MLGTSFPEWIFIHLCIVFFRYTPLLYAAALTILYLSFGGYAKYLVITRALFALLVAEGLFYAFLWRPFQARLGRKAVHPTPLSTEERRALVDQCLRSLPSPETYLRGWFFGAEPEDIRRGNVREFILWAFFEQDEASLAADDDADADAVNAELDEYVAEVERVLGRELGDGRGPAKCLRLTIDGIDTAYRSLAWYAVIFLVDQATHLALAYHGFQYYTPSGSGSRRTFPPRPQQLITRRRSPAPELGYWYRPHGPEERGKAPVVFFHGIGVGLWTYVRFLADIAAARRRGGDGIGVIAIEILPISFRLTATPLDKPVFLRAVATIVDHHGWDRFAVASHSYGSVLVTHMLRSPAMEPRITSVILIDPVSLMLHLPDVAYNFTRRGPRRANEWQLWYFASSDPGVAHCLGRHFFWRQNIIWKEELLASGGAGRAARRSAVCLSGRDLIVNTSAVAQYIAGPQQHDGSPGDDDVEVVIFPELDHAQVFDDPESCDRVVSLVTNYCSI
ncbi:uncharacterized protein DNG_01302 [Cephalotrichum gorgonifer]|uniref:AB hydrolase-1 domain-containing protein n=1 Tax=Cephalotrichum gorgonifer TaxID=2041049 RepID=A0AAE8MSC2_9PEZI|nr:uncharacterized protein DNG_01302 [Cephalotrichum gorgonifer]